MSGRVRAESWLRDLRSPDRSRKLHGLQKIAQEREASAAPLVRGILECEQDREIIETAGCAAFRAGDLSVMPALQQRADAGPDDYTRAKLIIYACRLSQRDWRLLDWALAGARSSDPWRHVGACIGLLELGRPEGGEMLLARVKEHPGDVQAFALTEFKRLAEPMAQAVGQVVEWPDKDHVSAADWGRITLAWRSCAGPELLADVLGRLEGPDPQWYEVNRLLHARKRVAKWLS